MPKGYYTGGRRPSRPLSWRFYGFVEPMMDDRGCWEWTGSRDPKGYGRIKSDGNVGCLKAHRASWLLHYGEIPNGLFVCHKCDNPPCVNPYHLFLGTNKDNQHDAIVKGRFIYPEHKRGAEHSCSKLSVPQAREIRSKYTGRWGEQRKLADEFGVSVMVISRLLRNETYITENADVDVA